jgi:hypothetical protein
MTTEPAPAVSMKCPCGAVSVEIRGVFREAALVWMQVEMARFMAKACIMACGCHVKMEETFRAVKDEEGQG